MARSGNRQSSPTTRKNVVHRGQRATLNGKPVVADGKGNWKSIPKGSAGNGIYTGATAGSYKKGEDRKSTPTKTKPKKPKTKEQIRAEALARTSYTVSGVEYWRDSGKAKAKPGGFSSPNGYSIDPKTGKRTNGHTAPPPPKPKPSPTPTPTPTRNPAPAASKPAPTRKPAPRAATSANAQNLRSGPTPPKPRAATGANAQSLRSGPTPPKPNQAKKALKSLQIKPKQKKLTNKQRKQGGFH